MNESGRPSAAMVVARLCRDLRQQMDSASPRERRALETAHRAVAALAREMEYQRLRERDKKRRARSAVAQAEMWKDEEEGAEVNAELAVARSRMEAPPTDAGLVAELMAGAVMRELLGEAVPAELPGTELADVPAELPGTERGVA